MRVMLSERAIESLEQGIDSKRRWAAMRARTYMLENIDDAISVRRLSSTLGVSERTPRNGFQDLYGMSPSKYLKAVRMHRVRQALQRAHSSRTTGVDLSGTSSGRFLTLTVGLSTLAGFLAAISFKLLERLRSGLGF